MRASDGENTGGLANYVSKLRHNLGMVMWVRAWTVGKKLIKFLRYVLSTVRVLEYSRPLAARNLELRLWDVVQGQC